jgi:hypothetical protein
MSGVWSEDSDLTNPPVRFAPPLGGTVLFALQSRPNYLIQASAHLAALLLTTASVQPGGSLQDAIFGL